MLQSSGYQRPCVQQAFKDLGPLLLPSIWLSEYMTTGLFQERLWESLLCTFVVVLKHCFLSIQFLHYLKLTEKLEEYKNVWLSFIQIPPMLTTLALSFSLYIDGCGVYVCCIHTD